MAEITAHHGIVKDTNLHVDDTGGSGRPLVLIHGWPLSGASWSEQVPAFEAAGYRVITYDRRGFGHSDKPLTGYGYDALTEDLHTLLEALDLTDVTLVGFSMGGGEVARYFSEYGAERIRSVVFASAVPPFLLHTPGNPEGPLTAGQAAKMAAQLTANQEKFYDGFVTDFFSANGALVVTEEQRQRALALTTLAKKEAALATMTSFGSTDFRDDLPKVSVPTLVIHGDADATVPFEGSGKRIHEAIPGSELHVVAGGPHGVNVSHAEEWNRVVLNFVSR
ncbi:alpha/beta fold hydrolase [Herbiconiux sp. L3-i23]|uniref:alpha/beta fold hydrolase n=1 Tax=Herbiconiux sp. L3-i23 TaxID=2905871 RepID=UPI002070E2EE|nr:alpha/beta hydrolase [Herbiconiux sp. L3-i23]BDI23769.1 arylesterase [Herbiconiux sp. L3-i23]